MINNYKLIQMYRRQDNDIFGTNQIGYSPRIENNNYVDPNAAFKRKTEQNYQKYASQVNQVPRIITAKSKDTSTVNEKANFQDNYHKNRKELDMQSSIFYPPPTLSQSRQITSSQAVQPKNSRPDKEQNFGRKQTLNRQINSFPYNNSEFKGNSSRLFDLDLRINKTTDNEKIVPLIPCQMQWDQHDSVKYAHINSPNTTNKPSHKNAHQSLHYIQQSKSTYIPKDPQNQQQNPKEQVKPSQKKLLKVKSESKIPTAKTIPNAKVKEPVQIKILKGWDFKLMEGLSKQCKLNNVAILKFETCEKDQANLTLKRSERWQIITDWLRKDAKLKIRVLNN